MGAIVLDGVKVGARSIVAAGALVTMGTEIPPGSMVMGSPAKVVRTLDLEQQRNVKTWADNYVELSRRYLTEGIC